MTRPIEKTLAAGLYNPDLLDYSPSDFDGYSAAPLLIIGSESNPDLIASQDKLAWKMADAAYGETVKVAKPSVALFVARSVVSRMSQREGMNGMSYSNRRHRKPRVDLVPFASKAEVLEACSLSRRGNGSPVQHDMARRAFGMMSAEVANLTIFNDFRSEQEAPMWGAVSKLTGRNATASASQMYGLRVLGLDRPLSEDQHLGAVRIEMKRKLGELDDGTKVKVRTTAIINVSPSSGFNQDIIERFKEFQGEKDEHLLRQIATLPEFCNAVAWLIDAGMPKDLVLARNETVYEDARLVVDPPAPSRWQALRNQSRRFSTSARIDDDSYLLESAK